MEKHWNVPSLSEQKGRRPLISPNCARKPDYITMDPGFGNTGSCKSAITYLDGDKGILRYRGIPIEQLAEKSTFVETSYLLIYGKLPNQKELEAFSEAFNEHSTIHEDMINFFDCLSVFDASHGHPFGHGLFHVRLLS